MGLGPRHPAAFHPAWPARPERLCRELQRARPRRVPQRKLVYQPGACPRCHLGLAQGLQPRPPAPIPRRENTRRAGPQAGLRLGPSGLSSSQPGHVPQSGDYAALTLSLTLSITETRGPNLGRTSSVHSVTSRFFQGNPNALNSSSFTTRSSLHKLRSCARVTRGCYAVQLLGTAAGDLNHGRQPL